MYLKKLESIGFKSFAERIQVEFVPGVTAVVGPNGSGKSNIIDAIRWVLGEQSAKSLRGSKMEDIIFQGSDTRKALNVAEVTLVLDNKDHTLPLEYEEVSITRRVYRSGESEFYINKQSCRLKDIIDLFMDTGLGRDSFSIISQGKVEEILSSKPEERRSIFEEAAGVLKYKNRKKKAEFKLAETQENLNRVEDIIYEIEQQLTPLEQQAETAKKYLKLKEELKEEEISLLVAEISLLHEQWQKLKKELEEQKDEEIKLKTEIQKKEAWIAQEREKLDSIDKKVENLQEQLLHTTEQLEKLEGKKQLVNERTKHLAENKQKLEKQMEETAEKIGAVHDILVKEEKNLLVLTEEKKEMKKRLSEVKEKLKLHETSIPEQIEELKADYIEYLNEQAALRNEKHSVQKQLEQLVLKKDRQKDKYQDLEKERSSLAERKTKLGEQIEAYEKKLAEKQTAIKNWKLKLTEERTRYEELQRKQFQGYQYIEKLKSKKEWLEEMKEDFQGFYQGVKSVLKAREENQLADIYGAVIELITVPSRYITAIETVLGGQAQHIIVKDDLSARRAIQWLKQTNRGRATFLPIASIQVRSVPFPLLEQIKAHPGFVGIAAQLIETDKMYIKAINHLMGHVIIAKTLKDANEIAALTGRKYRVVTLEGDVVHPGGSMSGGAQKKTNQSLFTREKDIQVLAEQIKNYEEKIRVFEKKVDDQKAVIDELENKLKDEDTAAEQEELQQIQSEFTEVDLRLQSLNEQLFLYDQDQKQFLEEKNMLEQQLTGCEAQLSNIKDKLASLDEEISKLSKMEKEFNENREDIQKAFHQYEVQQAELEERYKHQVEKVETMRNELKEYEEQYDLYKQELDTLVRIETEEETEEEIEEAILDTAQQKNNLTAIIREKRAERSEITERLLHEERELKEENKVYEKALQQLQEKEVQVNRLDVELENRLHQLQSDYTISFEKARQSYPAAENIEAAKAKVKDIKFSIERLGSVNLGAIDEYKRISERFQFLTEQREDLLEAKDTLFNVIREMDDEMKKRFESTFIEIQEQFTHVFKTLFGGGRAELKLTDPKDLLETGVDIIAQPPGKKLQHLGLLSGGERALTAIALLFAILRVRPVPFCILDEVEAALDEANVVRFAKYLKQHAKDSQFIVITHRKGTMEEADVLYGVTMQESGVSKLVSVRLEETEQLIHS